MQDIRKLLSCQIKVGGVISRSPSTVQDEDEDDEFFPLKNKEDLEEVELRLQNMKEVVFKAKLVSVNPSLHDHLRLSRTSYAHRVRYYDRTCTRCVLV